MIRKFIFTAACAAALAASGCATSQDAAQTQAPVTYTVVAADASIPFATTTISNYRVGKDVEHSLLLEAGSRWYRAGLEPSCSRDLRWEQAIAFKADATDRLDKFSSVLIDGRRCRVLALDQIVDPDAPAAPPAS